jgi:hypothetical protein
MSETIELQIVKPKRVYKKKVKEVSPQSDADSESSTTSLPVLSLEVPESVGPSVNPKRSYTRKPKVVALEEVILSVPPPPALVCQSNEPRIRLTTELIDTPPSSPKAVAEPQVKEKKPRTEKQIAAFNKMRDARLAKQEELNRLKELEREEKRIDSEKSKLDKVTEQVLNKATEIKKKRASRKKVVEEVEPVFTEPQQIPIIKEKTIRPILFV